MKSRQIRGSRGRPCNRAARVLPSEESRICYGHIWRSASCPCPHDTTGTQWRSLPPGDPVISLPTDRANGRRRSSCSVPRIGRLGRSCGMIRNLPLRARRRAENGSHDFLPRSAQHATPEPYDIAHSCFPSAAGGGPHGNRRIVFRRSQIPASRGTAGSPVLRACREAGSAFRSA